MNFATQIKITFAALALFAAMGVAALTRPEPMTASADADVVSTRVEIAAASADGATVKSARVHVGAPVMVEAQPSAEDVARAAR